MSDMKLVRPDVTAADIESGQASTSESVLHAGEHRLILDVSAIADALAAYSPAVRKQALAAIHAVHLQVEAKLIYSTPCCSLFEVASAGVFTLTYRAFSHRLQMLVIETHCPPRTNTRAAFVVERPGRLHAFRILDEGQGPSARSGSLVSATGACLQIGSDLEAALSAPSTRGVVVIGAGTEEVFADADGAGKGRINVQGNTTVATQGRYNGGDAVSLDGGAQAILFEDRQQRAVRGGELSDGLARVRGNGGAAMIFAGAGLATLSDGPPPAAGYDALSCAGVSVPHMEDDGQGTAVAIGPEARYPAFDPTRNGSGIDAISVRLPGIVPIAEALARIVEDGWTSGSVTYHGCDNGRPCSPGRDPTEAGQHGTPR